MTNDTIAIIIPAYNASNTIGRAVVSALREEAVSEVIVINDASTDDTTKNALALDDGTGRLKVIELEKNSGPSIARNRGIAESTAPWIGIIDADDFIMPGRFVALLSIAQEADFIADHRWNVPEGQVTKFNLYPFQLTDTKPRKLSFSEFVNADIKSSKINRTEIGFIKPIMRRSFLDKHNLNYQPHMRLGEDYELYARALGNGARFYLIQDRGYVSVIRENSLSGQHSVDDLKAFRDCDRILGALPGLTEADQMALREHYLGVDKRVQWRLLIKAVKNKDLKGFVKTFIHPYPIPLYLFGQLLQQLYIRSAKRIGLPLST